MPTQPAIYTLVRSTLASNGASTFCCSLWWTHLVHHPHLWLSWKWGGLSPHRGAVREWHIHETSSLSSTHITKPHSKSSVTKTQQKALLLQHHHQQRFHKSKTETKQQLTHLVSKKNSEGQAELYWIRNPQKLHFGDEKKRAASAIACALVVTSNPRIFASFYFKQTFFRHTNAPPISKQPTSCSIIIIAGFGQWWSQEEWISEEWRVVAIQTSCHFGFVTTQDNFGWRKTKTWFKRVIAPASFQKWPQ